jgi:hypothetical protein
LPFTIITQIIGFFINKYTQKIQLLDRCLVKTRKNLKILYPEGSFTLT